MSDLDRHVGEFVDAWNAGERPDVRTSMANAPKRDRAELAARLEAWLALAPTPGYDEATRAAIAQEPALLAARAAVAELRAREDEHGPRA